SGAGFDRAWSFRTAINTVVHDVTFFGTSLPAVSTASDGRSVELGMRFHSTLSGRITALRFFKTAGDTGTHKGTLWSSDGTALATVTFQNETADGWQRAALVSPV